MFSHYGTNRTVCDVITDIKSYLEANVMTSGVLPTLIIELHVLAKRMEEALYDVKDLKELHSKIKESKADLRNIKEKRNKAKASLKRYEKKVEEAVDAEKKETKSKVKSKVVKSPKPKSKLKKKTGE